jgi:hypothetical protein
MLVSFADLKSSSRSNSSKRSNRHNPLPDYNELLQQRFSENESHRGGFEAASTGGAWITLCLSSNYLIFLISYHQLIHHTPLITPPPVTI